MGKELGKKILVLIMALLMISATFQSISRVGGFAGTIKIGIIGPHGLPHWSPGMKEAAEMAAEEINAAGGVHLPDGDYEIVLAFGNEHAYPTPDPNAAAAEMERLIVDEGCQFIIGGFRTECTAAMIEVAADYGIPFFIDGSSTSALLADTVGQNYDRYKYLFRVTPVNSTILFYTIAANLAYFFIPERLLPIYGHDLGMGRPQVRVAVITEDLRWTIEIHEALTNPAIYPNILGPYVNVTYSARIPDGTTDCTPWLLDIINSKARLIIHVFSGVTGVPFVAQWRALEVNATLVGINVMAQLQTHWDTTGGACEYETILNFAGTRTPIIPGLTDVFWDNFVAKTGAWPLYTAWGAYDAIYMLKEAFEAIGSTDKDALVAYFEDPSFERTGLSGKFRFTSLHDVYCNEFGPYWTEGYVRAFMVQWIAGRMEVVSPVDQIYSKRWPLPPWMYPLISDINYDGKTNILDISLAAGAFGTSPGDPRWQKDADINYDNTINIIDIARIAADFGKEIPLPLP